MQKIYNYFNCCFKGTNKNSNFYLLSSRRAAIVTDISTWKDIKEYATMDWFNGLASDFFLNRFGLQIDKTDDFKIHSIFGKCRIIKLAKKYINDIFKISYEEKNNYLNYLKKHISKNATVIDLGYRGTVQYHLSRILNQKYLAYTF